MKKQNFKQIFAKQKKLEELLKIACPNIEHRSGLYFLTREEDGKKYAYIGKGVDVCRRMVSHLQGYQQRIDISLRKRGFYSNENDSGWKLSVRYFDEQYLDEKERFYIEDAISKGLILYNIESGGTVGKEIIGERKTPKTYRDGLAQGEENIRKKVRVYFEKYLDYTIKQPANKIKERKLEEFSAFLREEKK